MWILRCKKKKSALKSATSENCGFLHAGESTVENPLRTHNVWTYPEFDMVSGTYCACLWSGPITKSAIPNLMLTNFYLWQGIFIFKYPVGLLFFFFYNAHVILCKITYFFYALCNMKWSELKYCRPDAHGIDRLPLYQFEISFGQLFGQHLFLSTAFLTLKLSKGA